MLALRAHSAYHHSGTIGGPEIGADSQRRKVKKPRVTRRALEPFCLTPPEAEAQRLRREGKTIEEIARAIIARFGESDGFDGLVGFEDFVGLGGPKGLVERGRRQVDSLRDLDEPRVRRTIQEWLAKGRLRRRGEPQLPEPGVPVWVDRARCATCEREGREYEMACLRKFVVPCLPAGRSSDTCFASGYCRRCKRHRRFRVVESRRVESVPLVTEWAQQPPLSRSRFLLAKVFGTEPAQGGRFT